MLPKLNFESAVSSKYELYNFKKWFFNNYSNTNEFNEKKKKTKKRDLMGKRILLRKHNMYCNLFDEKIDQLFITRKWCWTKEKRNRWTVKILQEPFI